DVSGGCGCGVNVPSVAVERGKGRRSGGARDCAVKIPGADKEIGGCIVCPGALIPVSQEIVHTVGVPSHALLASTGGRRRRDGIIRPFQNVAYHVLNSEIGAAL